MDNQVSIVTINSCGLRRLSRSSSLKNSFRRHREPVWITNIRQQLSEQLKCLDFRLETHVLMLNELQDFYRRRAEVESEYAHSMEKLVKQAMTRHRNEKQKRESWPDYSTYTVWQTLLSTTHKLGNDHEKLGELYSSQMVLQIQYLAEYIQRAYKRCREMIVSSHEELVRVLTELQTSLKTYQKYHGEFVQADTKLKTVENEQNRLNLAMEKPNVILRRKLRNLEKQLEKKQLKHLECNLKAVKARNEYLLCLEAANSSLQKYFTDNINELIDALDFGYHDTLCHTMQFHTEAEDCIISSRKGCLDLVKQQVSCLGQLIDKQSFLERVSGPFALPQRFNFQPHLGDKVGHLSVEDTLHDDVLDRMGAIQERLRSLIADSEEALETIQTTAVMFLSHVNDNNIDLVPHFQDGIKEHQASALDQVKSQSEKLEAEEIYFSKFREYQSTSNLIARLQAKYNYIEKAFNEDTSSLGGQTFKSASMSSIMTKRKEKTKSPLGVRPQLFGGTLEEYIRLTGEEIPLIVRSSIRVINLYGMHHQGIFRIPGSQKEINDYRNQFEKGKDPFDDKMDGRVMDSVAGVLKLYFRELRDPLFPSALFDELASFIGNRSFTDPSEVARSIYDVRHLLMSSTKHPIFIVMRYLFSFLNHLSEFSDENMMDPLNLAICLGPTLLPVPSDRDLVQYQGHVTELIKNIIIYQEEIFPRAAVGPIYEKCIIQVNLGIKSESKNSLFDDDFVLEDIDSGDDTMAREAVALYDFQSRTDRELSFKKGDAITVFEKVSTDWWEAVVKGQGGLIPDKYIVLLPEDLLFNNKWENNVGSKLNDLESSQVSKTELTVNLNSGTSGDMTQPTCLNGSHCLLKSDSIGDSDSYFFSSSNPNPEATVIQSQENQEIVLMEDSVPTTFTTTAFIESDKTKTTEQLKSDIDAALADVFSGIKYLSGTAKSRDPQQLLSEPEERLQPDLVNDLPAKVSHSNVLDEKVVRVRKAKAKSNRPTSYGPKISHHVFPSLPDKSFNNFQESMTIEFKEPIQDSIIDSKVYHRRSVTPKTHEQTKAPSVLQMSRHSLASHSYSTDVCQSVPSHEKSQRTRQQNEFFDSRRDRKAMSSAMMSDQEFHANEALKKDKILAVPIKHPSQLPHSDASPSRRNLSAQNLSPHSVKVSRLHDDVSLELSEPKFTDIDDYTPSFI